MFILTVRVMSGPIATAIQFVNRLVIAVWIMIHGKSFYTVPLIKFTRTVTYKLFI